ncbi:MAG: aspartate--tRNA ligase [Candidatus Abawacabacteria bacterium]|nr:aspartate--tRNA ligase [Candidatus Abawacabacteria bacterium]
MFRNYFSSQLSKDLVGKEVTLAGWVHRRRDHGELIFIDLRDRDGVTQIVFNPEVNGEAHALAEGVRSEYVLSITGTVVARPEGLANKHIATGEIEIHVNQLVILNTAKTPPFAIDEEQIANEELRLKYRYLDLRRERMQNNLKLRHKVIKHIRDYFSDQGFLEIETPILIKGTPEGSREYLVPSRLHAGNFYVLPQSPQQLKQLCMVAGLERYFQIARCFRDEDQRGDRQPEFTQLDEEFSFVTQEDIIATNEKLLIELSKEFLPEKKLLHEPFLRMTWHEAMSKYGSDKPDIRFDLSFIDVSEIMKNSGFKVFSDTVQKGGIVKAMRVPGGAKFTRKQIDDLTEVSKSKGAKGLAYLAMEESGELKSTFLKFLDQSQQDSLVTALALQKGDMAFFTADMFFVACESLGQVRLAVAKLLNLQDESLLAYLWVIEFPMFERDSETGNLQAMHHPFTRPLATDVHLLDTNPEQARAVAHDVVLNGIEIGGGSMRIHERDLQSKIFSLMNISEADAERRFGHMLEAFSYGAPPHGGMAWGLDRLVMLFANEPNIREVIAFPKNQTAQDLMLGAPSPVTERELREANIQVSLPQK